MIRALTIATVVTGLAASGQIASAGVYVSVGVGSTDVHDSYAANPFAEDSRSLRGAGGFSFSQYIAAEVGVIGFDLDHGGIAYDGREIYAAGLLHLPIGNGFGGFGRLGVQHTAFDTDTSHSDFEGTGYLAGGGFEYRLPTPAVNMKLWVDYTHSDANLTAPTAGAASRDVGVSMWTLGATIGF